MMKKIKTYLYTILLLTAYSHIQAQKTAIMDEVAKIQAQYKNPAWLSYSIKYLYATEAAPEKYTDSLSGSFKLHDSSFAGQLDKIIFLQNNHYNLTLFSKDKIVLVNNPAKKQNKAMPLANWDTMFAALNIDSSRIIKKGSTHSIQFVFTTASNYKNFTMQYDGSTYRLKKMQFTLKNAEGQPQAGNPQQQGNMVTILFYNYSQAPFSTSVFDHQQYIQQKEDKLITTPVYSSYKLYDVRLRQ